MSEALVKALDYQARACAALNAPFSARILEHASADLLCGGTVAQLLAEWRDDSAEQLIRDAIALRFLASLHYLALNGEVPDLTACYPPVDSDADRAWLVALEALDEHPETVRQMLLHEPQTNEVRRSACLLGGFLTIARETGLPLRCFELGASAGLNSHWDRFRYEIGEVRWGDPGSPVVLSCRWDGNAPDLDDQIHVRERQACDRRPIDINQATDALRLTSYCWADQQERMARLQAAIGLAQREPMKVWAESAVEWIGRAEPLSGVATVVFHSIVWQYIPPDEQALILERVKGHAERASAKAPFYWLRMEFNESEQRFELQLRTWRAGNDRLLAVVHPHGEYAVWQ